MRILIILFLFFTSIEAYAAGIGQADKHWKAPVASVSYLPLSGNQEGDIRFSKADNIIYCYTGGVWYPTVPSLGGTLARDAVNIISDTVDNSTIEISGSALAVKDGGITEPKLDIANSPTSDYILKWDGMLAKMIWASPSAVVTAQRIQNAAADTFVDTELNPAEKYIRFWTNSTERGYIDNSGNFSFDSGNFEILTATHKVRSYAFYCDYMGVGSIINDESNMYLKTTSFAIGQTPNQMYIDSAGNICGQYDHDVDGLGVKINTYGYQRGTTRYRSLSVYDGKANIAFYINGVNKRIGIETNTPSYDLSFLGNTARIISPERRSTSTYEGLGISILAGGAKSGETDKAGGDLILGSGIATGSGSSSILLKTATAGGAGTTDRTPTTKLTLNGSTLTFADAYNIVFDTSTGTKIGTATSQKMAFYNQTPCDQPAPLTLQLSSLTYTSPVTPDYAIQDLTQTTPYGFVTSDEAQTVLSVIANLQTRVQELEDRLEELGLVTAN